MLAEALVYAASLPGTPSGFRKHLGEAVGLWARGRRQHKAWAGHLRQTQDAITDAMTTIRTRRTVAVLGSGPLYDVPLDALAATFATVVLIDRIHLLPPRWTARRHANVRFEHRDLGMDGEGEPLAFLAGIAGLDWVISVNLVSQLALGAADGSERRAVDDHLDGLRRLPCPVTLVTDLEYREIDRSGRVVEHKDILYGRSLPEPDKRWNWEVAPFGEEGTDARRMHAVAAFLDWKAKAQ